MRRGFSLLGALAISLAACSTPVTAPAASPSGTEKVTITATTSGELLAVYNAWQSAMSRKDLAGFQATTDLTRAAYRRCETEYFDNASRRGFNPIDAKIAKVEPYLDTYVRAYLGSDAFGYSRVYFRRDGGKWIRTEPLATELGGDKLTTIKGVQFSYFGIDDDVIDKYAAAWSQVNTFLQAQAEGHAKTGQTFGLRVFPTRVAAGSSVGCNIAGFHIPADPNDPFLRIMSNALSFNADLAGVTESTLSIMRHEGLHWLQDQFSAAIFARVPWWMIEGWADYIGQSRSVAAKRSVVCGAPVPTYKQLEDGLISTPETPPDLLGQYYAFANTMVEYLYKTYGSNAYWDLATVYKDGVVTAVNMPKALNVTPEVFYASWLKWAKQTYC